MKQSRIKYILSLTGVLLISILIVIGCSSGKDNTKPVLSEGFKEFNGADITFQWKITGDTLEAVLSAPTNGWVAVGFNPSEMMKDANIIIGFISKENTVSIRDDYGSWLTSHVSDESQGGTSDVTIIGGEESKSRTTIRFTIPLDSGDVRDQVIRIGEKTRVILSYGRSDDINKIHKKKTKTEITF